MSTRRRVRFLFGFALALLILSGIAASISILNLLRNTQWVEHTYDVKQSLSKVETALSTSGRLRATYIASGDSAIHEQFNEAVAGVEREVLWTKEITADNPVEQKFCERLGTLAKRRIEVLQSSVNEFASGKSNAADDATFSGENLQLASETADLLNQMQSEEDTLLAARVRKSDRLFQLSVAVIAVMFLSSLILIAIHYRMLTIELQKREQSEASLRQLSARLLRLQDEERRRFSRELHDGLGQILAVLKWTLTSLQEKHPDEAAIPEAVGAIDEAILSTRTISHLLHPPLLDEAGFDSAARWYVEGFSQRSGIPVSLTIADCGRLPRTVELALFRVLQEALTNIHRHSKAPRAEVSLKPEGKNVVLCVRDFGAGIPEDTLENFLSSGTRVGVGLAGMRERIREQGGQFEIHSSSAGTTVEATLPRTAPTSIENEFTDASTA